MLRIPQAGDRVVNRRYTIRDFDPARAAVTIDVSLHGRDRAPIGSVPPGSEIELTALVRGARSPCDRTRTGISSWPTRPGAPGALAMIEVLPPGLAATAVFEVDTAADEQEFRSPDAGTVDVRWLHRDGRSQPGDASLIVEALGRVDVPAGTKHAYVAAEAGVVRRVRAAVGRTRPRRGPDLGQGLLAAGPSQRGARRTGS